MICYYEAWQSSFSPDDIDVDICTHVNYAFFGLNEDGTLRLDDSEDTVRRVSSIKSRNPNVKVLISVGGWAEGSAVFSHVAADAGRKANMASSTLSYLDDFNCDGIDIDWEYPTQRDGASPEDKENFIDMLWVLRNALGDDRMITVAVSSFPDPDSYNVAAISDVVDAINVMTYDFHSPDDGKAGENSPLYAASTDSDWDKQNGNCDSAITNWILAGADPANTILGLAFYGKSYTLADPSNHGINSPTTGAGTNGGSYPDICVLEDGWTTVFDEEQRVPYTYKGYEWIGYDDPQSIAEKVQYAKNRGLGGVMMWAVDQDDKDGVCGTKNALLQEIKNNL